MAAVVSRPVSLREGRSNFLGQNCPRDKRRILLRELPLYSSPLRYLDQVSLNFLRVGKAFFDEKDFCALIREISLAWLVGRFYIEIPSE